MNKIVKRTITPDVLDVLLFGSAVKGKDNPEDVDVCIIFREKIDLELIKQLDIEFEKNKINAHISSLTCDNFFTKEPHALIRTLLFEGISLLNHKKLSDIYGLNSLVIYNYDLSGIPSNEKTKFVYTLKGRRNEKGLIKLFGGRFIAPGVFIVPVDKDKEVMEVLDAWKIKYKRKTVFLVS